MLGHMASVNRIRGSSSSCWWFFRLGTGLGGAKTTTLQHIHAATATRAPWEDWCLLATPTDRVRPISPFFPHPRTAGAWNGRASAAVYRCAAVLVHAAAAQARSVWSGRVVFVADSPGGSARDQSKSQLEDLHSNLAVEHNRSLAEVPHTSIGTSAIRDDLL